MSSVLGKADANSVDFVKGLFVGVGIVGGLYGLVEVAKRRRANRM
ncbi:hypothetical protein OMP38_19020 [Cohnella ginsengisoli]|uniref:Uncharacterized protein n=1 Tax=Cohnella ginsengisoli TaxID=425004 RepID=A0A9X4KN97_9BACL|nr:hypothetical protein [Cohnella ginsengisoli]MDG0792735.1 hypothetical protein [Cohnella ginsengisoli]